MDEQLNHAACGFLVFTDEGRILEMNATLERIVGFSTEELRGGRFETILTISSRIFHQTHFFPLLKLHGKAEEIFITLQTKDRQSVPMLAYAVRRDGVIDCVLVPVQQRQKYEEEILAAKRRAEKALRSNKELQDAKAELLDQAQELERRMRKTEQNNRELLQVTKILFHDLREPIRKIETFADFLRSQALAEEEHRLAVSKIESACGRMNQLLRSLQEFVSVEAVDDHFALVDLNAIVAEAYAVVSRGHPECVASFVVEKFPTVEGYPRQLQLLFLHLFENAFKFRQPELKLEIDIETSVIQHNSFKFVRDRYRYIDFVQIYFRDNGIGIAQENRDSVFELLQKLDARNLQPGCGLAICRKVAENHYGSISVAPSAARGTTFKILLPLKRE